VATSLFQITLPSGALLDARLTERRGSKRMTMRVDPTSLRLLVNGPMRVSKRDVLAFVNANMDWIDTRLKTIPSGAPFADGASILFRGRPTRLLRKDGKGAPYFSDGPDPSLQISSTAGRFEAHTRLALKAFAQSDALAYCDTLSARLGKAPTSIALRDTRSRWGSCTSAGDIMVSWRLIGAPPKVFEYVVAHELAHLSELNHSPRFWGHVSTLMPDWKTARSWLKANGGQLHALGR
jgi:predicted metal-dependent hydrolase